MFDRFSPTRWVGPTTTPVTATTSAHLARPAPSPALANAPTARARRETRTSDSTGMICSCDRPVSDPAMAERIGYPGRDAALPVPMPCDARYCARHT